MHALLRSQYLHRAYELIPTQEIREDEKRETPILTFFSNESSVCAIEYALIAAGIALAIIISA
jgi:hypothetical protein